MSADESFWKRCSTCKKEIPFAAAYWVCNVSTCNRARTALPFCSVPCWDAHVPMLRHRESWAEERHSPSRTAWERQRREAEAKERRAAERRRRGWCAHRACPAYLSRSWRAGAPRHPTADQDLAVVEQVKLAGELDLGMDGEHDGTCRGVFVDLDETLQDDEEVDGPIAALEEHGAFR
jgi:hypothetical protein